MRFSILDPKLASNWRRYLLQSGIATAGLVAALLAANLITGSPVSRAFVVGSIGSTAFVFFITPHSAAATPRHAIGGHAIGVVMGVPLGLTASALSSSAAFGEGALATAALSAVAVGLTMLAMAAFDAEHPPAMGTVLAVVTQGADWGLVSYLATAVVGLAALHAVLRRSMINLF